MSTDHLSAMGFGLMMGQERRASSDAIGWTAPTVIYDKMRQIQASAAALDADVHANVSDPLFVKGWSDWYTNWTAFFNKYQSDTEKASALFYTDELDRQVEGDRIELLGWYSKYQKQVGKDGRPVPPPTAEPPTRAPEEHKPGLLESLPGTGWSLPWWVWMIGGVAVVGAGYYLYKTYVGGYVRAYRGLKAAASDQPSGFQHPAGRYAGDERPRYAGSPEPLGPSYPAGIPLSVEDVAYHPMPPVQQISYRPYEHPHVVPARPYHDGAPPRAPRALRVDYYNADPGYDSDYDGDEDY